MQGLSLVDLLSSGLSLVDLLSSRGTQCSGWNHRKPSFIYTSLWKRYLTALCYHHLDSLLYGIPLFSNSSIIHVFKLIFYTVVTTLFPTLHGGLPSQCLVFLLAPAEQMALGEATACTETSDSKWLAITDLIIWFQVSPAEGMLLKSPSAQDTFHAVPGLWPAAVSHCNAACFYCIFSNAKREIELKNSGCISDRTVCELKQLLYADDYWRSRDAHTFNLHQYQ